MIAPLAKFIDWSVLQMASAVVGLRHAPRPKWKLEEALEFLNGPDFIPAASNAPELHPCLARTRRFIVPAVLLIAVILTMGMWFGMTPQLLRIPQQLVLMAVIWLMLAGLSRLRLPRWGLLVVAAILALGGLSLAFVTGNFLFATLMCTPGISTLLLLPGTPAGRIAARGGSRRDGDIAMAIFAGYVIGQFMPLFY